MTVLEKLKLTVGVALDDGGEDGVLLLLLENAREFVKAYCRVDSCGEEFDRLVLAVAAEDYGKMGAAGVSYRSVSGTYESYNPGYSDALTAQLRAKRKPGRLN